MHKTRETSNLFVSTAGTVTHESTSNLKYLHYRMPILNYKITNSSTKITRNSTAQELLSLKIHISCSKATTGKHAFKLWSIVFHISLLFFLYEWYFKQEFRWVMIEVSNCLFVFLNSFNRCFSFKKYGLNR